MSLLDFELFITERLGFRCDDSVRARLSEVLEQRVKKLRLSSVQAYLNYLRAPATGTEEQRVLAQELTIGETYFFRERPHFDALEQTALPERLRARAATRSLSILSLGCAAGEEAYTIAILLRERFPELASWKVDIAGADINTTALAKARRGVYTPWSLRDTPADIKERYFRERGGDFVLHDEIRNRVRFEECNAMQDSEIWRAQAWDVIFCRNMLIYFTLDAMTAVLARTARALAPGGYLFLSHSESLRGITRAFHLCSTEDTFYYQALAAGESVPEPSIWDPVVTQELWSRPAPTLEPGVPVWTPDMALDTSWVEAIQKSSDRIADLSVRSPPSLGASRHSLPQGERESQKQGEGSSSLPLRERESQKPGEGSSSLPLRERESQKPGEGSSSLPLRERADARSARREGGPPDLPQLLDLFRQERYDEIARQLRDFPSGTAHSQALVLLAAALTNRGKTSEAQEVCERILKSDELCAEAEFIFALCREHDGDLEGAIKHAHTAAYLDSGFAMPHLLIGRLSRRRGERDLAKLELNRARDLLLREDSTRTLLFGGGFGREALVQLCRRELAAV